MQEKILTTKKNGMVVMLLDILLLLAAIPVMIIGITMSETEGANNALGYVLGIGGMVFLCVGWIPMIGLKVLKPQEALVLTLFGNYIGTLKGEGFYFVNPFCTAVNPAAQTKLNQSGDVKNAALTPPVFPISRLWNWPRSE